MLGWSEDPENLGVFSETLAITKRMKRSLIIIACQQEQEKTYIPDGAINVWWTSQKNGALMLLLAYLLTRNNEWRDRPLRIIRPVAPKADIQNIEKEMGEQLSLARIEAELVIVPTETALDAVRIAMQPSAVLFVGFELPDEDSDPFIPQFQPIVDLPGDVILVYNAGDVSLDA